MRTIKEIIESGKIYDYSSVELHGVQVLGGKIYDRKEKITFTLGVNEGGWEHVAISVGSGRKIPSWEIMCKAKTVFWRDDEDAVQLHPKESAYFHGFPEKMEVLHLWRPVNGDWSLLNKMFGADNPNHPVDRLADWLPVWVDCDEEMPKNADKPGAFCEKYLIMTKFGVTEGWFNPDFDCWFALVWFYTSRFLEEEISMKRADVPKVCQLPKSYVTHWMPLPDPLREE